MYEMKLSGIVVEIQAIELNPPVQFHVGFVV